jgi:hypothetical protein
LKGEIVCEKKFKIMTKEVKILQRYLKKMSGKDLPFHVGAFHSCRWVKEEE